MSTFNQARYRYIDWIAERILEASELDRLQQIMQGVAPDDVTRWAWDLGAIYKEGATFNVTPADQRSDPGHSDVGTDEPLSELAAGHRQQHR